MGRFCTCKRVLHTDQWLTTLRYYLGFVLGFVLGFDLGLVSGCVPVQYLFYVTNPSGQEPSIPRSSTQYSRNLWTWCTVCVVLHFRPSRACFYILTCICTWDFGDGSENVWCSNVHVPSSLLTRKTCSAEAYGHRERPRETAADCLESSYAYNCQPHDSTRAHSTRYGTIEPGTLSIR